MQILPSEFAFFIVWIAGIVLSIYFRRQDPGKFTLTLVAFSIFPLISATSIFVHALLTAKLLSYEIDGSQQKAYIDALNCILIPLSIASWVILLIAIFGRRSPMGKEASGRSVQKDVL